MNGIVNVVAVLGGLALLLGVVLQGLNRLVPATAARWGLALERLRSGLSQRSIVIDGQTVPYLEGGRGEPLLLLHGFGADKDNFTFVARMLTPHYRVLIPDLAGFGEAMRDPQADYRMADQVQRMTRLLDALKITRVHLGGSSMGGFIAGLLAATAPDRVASLWLLNAAGTQAAHHSPLFERYLATGENPLLVQREADYEALLAAAVHRRPFMPFCVVHQLARRAVADFALHSKIMRQLAVESPTLDQQFTAIATPTLISWGECDGILAAAGAEAQHRLFIASTLVRVPGIGHLPMMEAPRRVAKDYLAFRRGLVGA
jgi:pimeloyl-ACP methyl ester carboxylesterase